MNLLARIVRVRYEKGALKPLEKLELKEGEEILIRIERLEERRKLIEEFYGKRGSAPRSYLISSCLRLRYSDTP